MKYLIAGLILMLSCITSQAATPTVFWTQAASCESAHASDDSYGFFKAGSAFKMKLCVRDVDQPLCGYSLQLEAKRAGNFSIAGIAYGADIEPIHLQSYPLPILPKSQQVDIGGMSISFTPKNGLLAEFTFVANNTLCTEVKVWDGTKWVCDGQQFYNGIVPSVYSTFVVGKNVPGQHACLEMTEYPITAPLHLTNMLSASTTLQPPRNPIVSQIGPTTASVTFDEPLRNGIDLNGYEIHCPINGGFNAQSAPITQSMRGFNLTGFSPSTNYTCELFSYNDGGLSATSTPVNFTTASAGSPTPPPIYFVVPPPAATPTPPPPPTPAPAAPPPERVLVIQQDGGGWLWTGTMITREGFSESFSITPKEGYRFISVESNCVTYVQELMHGYMLQVQIGTENCNVMVNFKRVAEENSISPITKVSGVAATTLPAPATAPTPVRVQPVRKTGYKNVIEK